MFHKKYNYHFYYASISTKTNIKNSKTKNKTLIINKLKPNTNKT